MNETIGKMIANAWAEIEALSDNDAFNGRYDLASKVVITEIVAQAVAAEREACVFEVMKVGLSYVDQSRAIQEVINDVVQCCVNAIRDKGSKP